MSESTHSIAGGWLGTYHYRAAGQPPTRFEATFTRLAGAQYRFGGTILDDGPLGEANVSDGTQRGLYVAFTKVYSPQNEGVAPVSYEGMLAPDGRTVSGTWEIAPAKRRLRRVRGVWEARRLWSENAENEAVPESAARALSMTAAP